MGTKDSHVGDVEQELRDLIAGMQKSFPATGQVVLVGNTYSAQDFTSKAQAYLVPFDDTHAARSALAEKVQVRDGSLAEVRAFIDNAHRFLGAYFGATSPKLADFGVKAKKSPRPLSGEENAQKAAKAKATRAKNGTLGKRQKQAAKKQTPPATPSK
ncbi:MAG TPA: hypothetical protein VFF73_29175 [Planctomycetota bacterium]|nr:hypothetical protein [Planctomycetota bacterium]